MLSIHFLNVGKGNCTIIDFTSGRLSMIDIDNSRISDDDEVLTDPVDYLRRNFANRSLFRFVLTHPDMDHLSGLDELARNVSILNFWDTEHNKTFDDDDWESSPYNQEDWERYLKFRRSSEDPKCLRPAREATADCCWSQDGIRILSPSPYLVDLSNSVSEKDAQKYNHLSYVLMLEYAGVKVLLGGDASVEAWQDIADELGTTCLKADVFLAPHHGSSNNINEDVFETIAPDYVIVSVASGADYDYQYYCKLARRSVLSTKFYGTIRMSTKDNGEFLPFIVDRGQ